MSATSRSPVRPPASPIQASVPANHAGRQAMAGNAAALDEIPSQSATPSSMSASATPTLDLVASAAPSCDAGPRPELREVFDLIELEYDHQGTRRGDALLDLEPELTDGEAPPLLSDLVVAAGSIALGAATAGIGGAVAGAVASGAAKYVQDAIKKAVDSALRDTIEGVGRAAFSDTTASPVAFLAAQRKALGASERAASEAFVKHRHVFEERPDGLAQAQELYCALSASSERDHPHHVQMLESSQQWCTYMAQAALGVTEQGTDLGPALGGSLSADLPEWLDGLDTGPRIPGVLQLEVHGGQPSEPVVIRGATLEGASDATRRRASALPLDALRVPMEVHGWVDSVATGTSRQVFIAIGRGETGSIWCRPDHGGGLHYLFARAGGTLVPGVSPDEIALGRFDGARAVFDEDIRISASLTDLGVRLDG